MANTVSETLRDSELSALNAAAWTIQQVGDELGDIAARIQVNGLAEEDLRDHALTLKSLSDRLQAAMSQAAH